MQADYNLSLYLSTEGLRRTRQMSSMISLHGPHALSDSARPLLWLGFEIHCVQTRFFPQKLPPRLFYPHHWLVPCFLNSNPRYYQFFPRIRTVGPNIPSFSSPSGSCNLGCLVRLFPNNPPVLHVYKWGSVLRALGLVVETTPT